MGISWKDSNLRGLWNQATSSSNCRGRKSGSSCPSLNGEKNATGICFPYMFRRNVSIRKRSPSRVMSPRRSSIEVSKRMLGSSTPSGVIVLSWLTTMRKLVEKVPMVRSILKRHGMPSSPDCV